MSMGIPFVTNRGWGDVAAIVRSEEGGLVVDALTEDEFKRVSRMFLEANKNPSLLRERATGHYDLCSGVDQYNEVYSRLIFGDNG